MILPASVTYVWDESEFLIIFYGVLSQVSVMQVGPEPVNWNRVFDLYRHPVDLDTLINIESNLFAQIEIDNMYKICAIGDKWLSAKFIAKGVLNVNLIKSDRAFLDFKTIRQDPGVLSWRAYAIPWDLQVKQTRKYIQMHVFGHYTYGCKEIY